MAAFENRENKKGLKETITHLEAFIKTKDAQIAELVEKLGELEKTNYSDGDDDSDMLNTSELEGQK